MITMYTEEDIVYTNTIAMETLVQHSNRSISNHSDTNDVIRFVDIKEQVAYITHRTLFHIWIENVWNPNSPAHRTWVLLLIGIT